MRPLDIAAQAQPLIDGGIAPAVERRVLESYAGKYSLPSGAVLTVALREGKLFAQRNDEESLPLYSSSETRFFYRVAPIELAFVADAQGHVDRLVVHADQDREAKRIA